MSNILLKTGLAALALGLTLAPAQAGSYRHHYNNSYVYTPQNYASDYPRDYGYRNYGYRSYQSDEIRELRRAFPSTNWPPSDRY